MEYGELAESYLSYLKKVEGHSDNSIRAYTRYLRQFGEFLALHLKNDPKALDYKSCERFVMSMDTLEFNRGTTSSTVAVVRRFWDWLEKHGEVGYNPWRQLARIKRSRKETIPLTEAQVMAILDGEKCPKYRAFWYLIYSTGARENEINTLLVGGVDLGTSGTINITAKGSVPRRLRISNKAKEVLRTYMDTLSKRKPLDPVFPALKGKGKFLSAKVIRQRLHWCAQQVGVEVEGVRVYPHLFRHSIATHMFEAGADPATIQKFLGHRHISTTMLYLHVTQKTLDQRVESFHPLMAQG